MNIKVAFVLSIALTLEFAANAKQAVFESSTEGEERETQQAVNSANVSVSIHDK